MTHLRSKGASHLTIWGKFPGRENSSAKVLRPQGGCHVGDALKKARVTGVVGSEVTELNKREPAHERPCKPLQGL